MKEKLMLYAEVLENADMTKYNTFHIGGKCKYLVKPNSVNDLIEILKYLKDNNIKYFIIGNGSNIVLSNELEDLVIIKLSNLNALEIHKDMNIVYAEAGAMLPHVAHEAIENSLTGLEFAIGIPGTIGGSIVGNAGAYNACILDYVKSVTLINENNELVTLDHEEIEYGYRTTMFKNKNVVIVSAKLYLQDGDIEESKRIVEDRKQRRLDSQPLDYPSAGSVFRNPEGDSAWHLVDQCGLKGYSIGGAKVSEKHANFIINYDNATSEDVYDLINYVHKQVKEKTNVDLKIEQEFVGWE